MSETGESSTLAQPAGFRPERDPRAPHPVFQWPVKPQAVLKWLFGFPGLLWPVQAVLIGISFLTWRFLTPDTQTLRHFSADWVGFLFIRNVLLLTAFVSIWHFWLYVRKAQGSQYKYNANWLATDDPVFLFRNQLWDNVFWNIFSAVPIWTAYEAVGLWLQANELVPVVDWRAHPIYCTVLLCFGGVLWADIHFYFTHRLIHWRPLYRYVHSLHHKNVNVGPWSGLAMHPVEHVIYFSSVILFWIIPSHPLHAMRHLQELALGASLAHHGFDRLVVGEKATFDMEHYTHYLHHKHVQCNFGVDVVPLDRWLGTFHDGSDESYERLKNRLRARALRSRATVKKASAS